MYTGGRERQEAQPQDRRKGVLAVGTTKTKRSVVVAKKLRINTWNTRTRPLEAGGADEGDTEHGARGAFTGPTRSRYVGELGRGEKGQHLEVKD